MTKLLIIAFIGLLAGVIIYASLQPDTFRVQRSIAIHAPADRIFPLVNDFHAWASWSPWEKIDPALTRTYSGAEAGPAAVYEWRGNKDVGHGRMEIVESSPPSRVLLKIDFITPFEAHNMVEFVLRQDGDTTTVTQAMFGPSPFISKVMGLFFSIDKMVGDKYEEGLASIKTLAESGQAGAAGARH